VAGVAALTRRIWRTLAAGWRRFFAVDGLDLGSLIAIELFTTVLPILLLAYAWLRRFSEFATIGQLFVRELQLSREQAGIVFLEFGTAKELEHLWTWFGITSFLVWGIPMSLTVGRAFALAWRRPTHAVLHRIWRGTLWFVLYLVTVLVNHRISLVHDNGFTRVVLLVPELAVSTIFWGASPVLLVQGLRWRWRTVIAVGLPGAIVNALMRTVVAGVVVPLLLSGWDGFGPIGVAFTLMTWCGVNGVTWVAIACLGAVIAEPERIAIDGDADADVPL